ncbi:MAG TPA: prepilin-type N-terminal cleavage/methylation domain-containing protein [Gammaproteobacteria bacterium]|nr:prepilin-type N-terminal cleavage/methylation domain-containing protein [Gammaproteobacteria bacterium]
MRPNQHGFSLLETLFSLAISLFLISLMVKLYGLQEILHYDVQQLSTLNRQAIITRQILSHAVEKNQEKYLYINKDNLYLKKPHDIAVELVSGVKNLVMTKHQDKIDIKITVFIRGNSHETKRLYSNNSINLHFFVKPRCTVDAGNECA